MKYVAALALATLALASCQDADKSYDAMHGPENVLQAPFTSDENRQQDVKNREQYELIKNDTALEAGHEKHDSTMMGAPEGGSEAKFAPMPVGGAIKADATAKEDSAEGIINPSEGLSPRDHQSQKGKKIKINH